MFMLNQQNVSHAVSPLTVCWYLLTWRWPCRLTRHCFGWSSPPCWPAPWTWLGKKHCKIQKCFEPDDLLEQHVSYKYSTTNLNIMGTANLCFFVAVNTQHVHWKFIGRYNSSWDLRISHASAHVHRLSICRCIPMDGSSEVYYAHNHNNGVIWMSSPCHTIEKLRCAIRICVWDLMNTSAAPAGASIVHWLHYCSITLTRWLWH